MNIAYFVSNLSNYSGASFQAMALAKNLPQDCTVYFFNKPSSSGYRGPYQIDSFTIVDLPDSRFLQILISIYFSLKWKIEIMHMHGFSLAAIVASIILHCKSILKTTLIGYDDFETWSKSTAGRLKIYFLKFVDVNVALTRRSYDINSKYSRNVVVKKIPNGINLPAVLTTEKDNIFCIVGIIHQRKRTLEAIQYFIDNYAYHGKSMLYIVGPLVNDDNLDEFSDAYINRCRKLVYGNQLEAKVKFTGKLPQEEVQKIYHKSMGLIFFSSAEGMPNVVLEALGNNCVPIMTDLDGDAYDIIEDDIEGFIIKEFTKSIPLGDIQKLLKSGNVYKRASHFSFQNVAAKYTQLYRQLNNG